MSQKYFGFENVSKPFQEIIAHILFTFYMYNASQWLFHELPDSTGSDDHLTRKTIYCSDIVKYDEHIKTNSNIGQKILTVR